MLSKEDNDILCRVGPDAPMGRLMREYWIPAIMTEELPTPDCPPMRLRLLGENLIAFRATSGDVGIIANACPHRGASMFFGRNEEDGLRCVYHGWKFDVTGACVDMPSEPSESNFKSKVRARAYPCIERNKIVWTYMGTRKDPPPLPDLPSNLSPNCQVVKAMRDCNYMQALEGDIDTVHAAFLHYGGDMPEDYPEGSDFYYSLKHRDCKIEVQEHEAGLTYGAYRPAEADADYWRLGHFVLPFYTYNATSILTQRVTAIIWVPIDDEHVMGWSIMVPLKPGVYGKPAIGGLIGAPARQGAPAVPGQLAPRRFAPDTSDWLGKFRSIQTPENDYLIDREVQREGRSPTQGYSGIPFGAEPQDRGMQESMGPIYDRTQEHLGTTDAMVIAVRKKLIKAAKALRDHGEIPAGVDTPEAYRKYSGSALIPKGVSGIDHTREILFGQSMKLEVLIGAS